LDCVIGQVHKSIVWIIRIYSILRRTGPEISFLTIVNVSVGVHEHPDSYVKLPLLYQKRPLNVFLNYKTVVFVFRFTLFSNGVGHGLMHLGGLLGLRSITQGLVSVFEVFKPVRSGVFCVILKLLFIIALIILALLVVFINNIFFKDVLLCVPLVKFRRSFLAVSTSRGLFRGDWASVINIPSLFR